MSNIVAIVGRPNVGKSTFFNRLVGERIAIMDNVSGVTRDRHYGQAEWLSYFYTVIDTGGYIEGSDDKYEAEIRKQVTMAIEEAAVVVFLVDAKEGITDLDRDFANIVRRFKKPILVAANKVDMPSQGNFISEFYGLGLGDVYPVSSQTGSGTGELLDKIIEFFEFKGDENPYKGLPRISIVGRPNVGKSSFLNTLIGSDRSIVKDEAGTTRDAIDTRYNMFGKDFIITDTAGIRRKARVKEDIEFYSVLRSLKAIETCDVCVIMLDATQGFEAQDMNIISLAHRNKKGIVLLVNKWDLVEKDTNSAKKMTDYIHERMAPINYFPVIYTSVTTKQRIFQAIEKALEVYENKSRKIPTSELNEKMLPEIESYPPPALKGKYIKIKYITQLPTHNPVFAYFCNLPQYIQVPYERYLENKMRKHFNLEGTPIQLVFRSKS
jgi:GTP-binding protein